MKFIAFFILSATLYGSVSAPDLNIDGLPVVSPNVGASAIPNGGFQAFQVCLNDNPVGAPNNDQDFNDGCASAAFGAGNVLTLTYLGALTSATNYIGVQGQTGWVGPGIPTQQFTYLPGVETIFAGYVNGGTTAVYLSGSSGPLNTPPGNYFYAECTLCSDEDVATPEPSGFLLLTVGLVGLAWVRRS